MQFSAIVLDRPTERKGKQRGQKYTVRRPEELKLWGLTLGMTLDFLACMHVPFIRDDKSPGSPSTYAFTPRSPDNGDGDGVMGLALAPSMTCVLMESYSYVF